MSTNSIIKIKGYKSIYCHWNGDLESNGLTLIRHFKNKRKVKKLISKGNISCLGSKINPAKKTKHNFLSAQDNVCVFYHRDRGEELEFGDSWNAYIVYEYDNGSWYYYDPKHHKVKITKEFIFRKS